MVESLNGVSIHETRTSMYEAAVGIISSAANRAISDQGSFSLALSGGTTPEPLYRMLVKTRIKWSSTKLYMVDERYVDYGDPESNFGMVTNALVERASIPPANVYPIPTGLPSPSESAEAYQKTLLESMGINPWPGFDMVVLGMGADGHTASLFPGSPELDSPDLVVSTRAPPVYRTPERVTITMRAINSSRDVIFLATGGEKKAAVVSVIGGNLDLPAARVRPVEDLHWLLTADVLA
jgi:6-phosphogluconolactonase